MATNSVEIANNALTIIGTRRITSLSDTSKEGRACNDNYDICRKACLRLHPWNFAVKRTIFTATVVSNAVASAGLIKITTATAHGYTTGDSVTVLQVLGTVEANGTWTVTVVNSTNFTLDGSTFTNTYVSGGYTTLSPKFDFNFTFALPSDFIRVHTLDDTKMILGRSDYQIDAMGLVTDFPIINVRYVYNITDTTKFDPLFDEFLAHYLAAKIVFKLTASDTERERCEKLLKEKMQQARFTDSTDNPSEVIDGDVWIRSRFGPNQAFNQGFVRDPLTW